ncbi:hypothetical protein D5S17_20060 [Pseudonocardiaceae bacterium YIM PH 21723]|nr:hypothetical protein D5S17_20060 [Pseudonocardiaceae bacterium YIM PH 21723]
MACGLWILPGWVGADVFGASCAVRLDLKASFVCLRYTKVDAEEFRARYGGHIQANWEAAGPRTYSSRDAELVTGRTSVRMPVIS